MAIATASVEEVCRAAKRAARALAALDTRVKNAALERVAQALQASRQEILEANAPDVDAGREAGLIGALIDRLTLDERRIDAMAAGVREIAAPARSGRRGARGVPATQRAAHPQGAGARSASSPSSTRRGPT